MACAGPLPPLPAQEDLEGEQHPQRLAMIASPARVRCEHRVNRLRRRVTLDPGIRRSERRVDVDTEILAKPPIEWDAEASRPVLKIDGQSQTSERCNGTDSGATATVHGV